MENFFGTVLSTTLTPAAFAYCTLTSVLVGALISVVYMKTSKRYTGSFVTTLAMLPAVVQIVIMMVNGNLGAGVAVAGAFSLVRFRSIPGTAREIGYIFIALATGLATGMGYLAFAGLFVAVMCVLSIVYKVLKFGEKSLEGKKMLTVVMPESLDYENVFDDVFQKYLSSHDILSVKTTNMGSLFKIKYEIQLKKGIKEKDFLDELRIRNGNLEIICAKDTLAQEIL